MLTLSSLNAGCVQCESGQRSVRPPGALRRVGCGLNGKGKIILVLFTIVQTLLAAAGGYWIGQTSSNTERITRVRDTHQGDVADLNTRVRVLEFTMTQIREDIRDIKMAVVPPQPGGK